MKKLFDRIINIIKSQLYTISLYTRKVAGTAVVFILARYLKVYDYGVYSSYSNIANYLLVIANLGFNEYILVSSGNNLKEVRLKQSYFITFAIIITLFYIIISSFFHMESLLVFQLILLKTLFDGVFFALILPYFQVAKQFNKIAVINIVYSIGIMAITTCLYIFKLSLVIFLALIVILGVVNFIQCSVGIRINYFLALFNLKKIYKFIDDKFKYFAFVSVILITQSQLYSVCISVFMPKEQAALFFAAFNIVSIIQLFAIAQIQQIMPKMVIQGCKELKKSIIDAQKILLFVFGGLIVFFIFGGKILLHIIYSKEYYLNAYPILIILSVINLTNIAGIYGCAVSAKGQQKQKMKIQIEILSVAVVAILLLYRFGMYGLICSFGISSTYSLIRYHFYCYKNLLNNN